MIDFPHWEGVARPIWVDTKGIRHMDAHGDHMPCFQCMSDESAQRSKWLEEGYKMGINHVMANLRAMLDNK